MHHTRDLARWRRRLRRALLGLVGTVLALVALALLALANLDAGPIKRVVQRLARVQGLELDYTEGSVTLGGARFRNLRLASPPVDRARAPNLVEIAAIDGAWSLWSGELRSLDVQDVALTVVRSADGTTSLQRWLAGLPPSEEPGTPLSALAQKLWPGELRAAAKVERIALTVLDDADPSGPRTLRLTGLGASAKLDAQQATVALRAAPAKLELRASGAPRELELAIEGAAGLTARGTASVRLEAKLLRQTFTSELPKLTRVLVLSGSAQLLPEQERVDAAVQGELLDGALALTAQLSLMDAEPRPRATKAVPLVRRATLMADVARLVAAAPAALGPLHYEGDPLRLTIEELALSPALSGKLSASLGVTAASWREHRIERAKLGLTAEPSGDRLRASVSATLEQLRTPALSVAGAALELSATRDQAAPSPPTSGEDPLAALVPLSLSAKATVRQATAGATSVAGLTVNADAELQRLLTMRGTVRAQLARLEQRAAAGATTGLDRLELDLAGSGRLAAAAPLTSSGSLTVTARASEARLPGPARASDVMAQAAISLDDQHRLRTTFELATQASVPAAHALGKTRGAASVKGTAELELRPAAPKDSHGTATVSVRFAEAALDADLAGSLAELQWKAQASAPIAGPARGLGLDTAGSYRLASGQLEHETRVRIARVATAEAALRGLALRITSRGDTRVHRGTAAVELQAVDLAGRTTGPLALQLEAAVDLPRPAAELTLRGTKPPAELRLRAEVSADRTVRWLAKGSVPALAMLAPFLPAGLDGSQLAVRVDGEGEVTGVLAGVRDGVPTLVRDPALTARGKQRLALDLANVRYRGTDETRAELSAIALDARLDLADTRRATIDLAIPRLDAVASGVKVGADELALRLELAATLRRGAGDIPVALRHLDVTAAVRAKSARQSALPWYGVERSELTARVSGDPATALSLALAVKNPGGGTSFELAGNLERNEAAELAEAPAEGLPGIVARKSLVVQGKLEQTLDGLAAAPETLRARGRVSVPFRIESGDLSLFRATAQVSLADVSATLPAHRLEAKNITGEVPLVQELVLDAGGLRRVGEGEHGLFSQLRFPDYKPFTGGRDYLSIGELTVRDVRLGPAAGNVRIDRDVIALDQLELAALGGKLTGQCVVELRGDDTRLAFRGKATGVRPSVASASTAGGPSGDRLDANLAVALEPFRLRLEGRTEIVQIGKDHLLALLNLWDPYHADISANRVRLGLKVGYPKQVRLHFSHGFANLAIELGGLAGVVRIDEIRGIPIGPVLSHFLSPILKERSSAP